MTQLRIWHNDGDWVIAESAQEALVLYAEHCGYDDFAVYQQDTDDMPSNWEPLDPMSDLRIIVEDCHQAGVDAQGGLTKKCWQWVAEGQKGFLCGVDF